MLEWIQAALLGVACWCTLFCSLLWLWEAGWIRPHWRHVEGNPFPPLGHGLPKRQEFKVLPSSPRWLNAMLQRLFYTKDSVLFETIRMRIISLLQRRMDDYRIEYGWLVEGLKVVDLSIGYLAPRISSIRVHETENERYFVAKVSFEGRMVISLQSQLGMGMGEWNFQAQFGKLQSLAVLRIRYAPHPCLSVMLTRMPKFSLLLDWGQTSMGKLSNLMHYLVRNLIRTRVVYPAWTSIHLRTFDHQRHLFLLPKPAPLQPSLMLRVIEGKCPDADSQPVYVYATLGSNQRFRTESLTTLDWNQVCWFTVAQETELVIQMYSKRRKISKSILLAEARIALSSLLADRIEQRLLTFEQASLRIELFWQTGTDQPRTDIIFPNGHGPMDTSPMVPPNWNSLRSALAAMRQQNPEDVLDIPEVPEVTESEESDGEAGWPLLPLGHRRHSIPKLNKPVLSRTWSQGCFQRHTWLCHWGEVPVEVERLEASYKMVPLAPDKRSVISLHVYLHSDLDYVDVSATHLLYSPLCRAHCLEGTKERVCIYPQGTSIYHAPVQMAWERLSKLTVTWYTSHCLLRFDVNGMAPLYYLADHQTAVRLYRWLQTMTLPSSLQVGTLFQSKHGILAMEGGECRLLDRFFGVRPADSLSSVEADPKTWTMSLPSVDIDDVIWDMTGLRVSQSDPLLEFSCSYLRRGIVVGKLSIFPGWVVIIGRRNGWRSSKFALPLDHLLRAELCSRWMNKGILLTMEGGEEMFLFGFKREAMTHCLAALIHFQMKGM